MYAVQYPPLDVHVQRVTHLTDAEIQKHGIMPSAALLHVCKMILRADIVIAHNKNYDEVLFKKECERAKIMPPVTPWYCSLDDIDYPEYTRCKQLSHLALDHGVMVDPSRLHRAIGDVETMGNLLRKGGYLPGKIVEFAEAPWVYLKATIPKPWEDGGAGKEQARLAGYSWETPRGCTEPKFEKSWVKRVKESKAPLEKDRPFKVQILKA